MKQTINEPITQWFLRAERVLDRDDRFALGELGAELQKMLFEAVLVRDLARVWEMFLHFMELSRQQGNAEVRLNWFREPPIHDWVLATTQQIDKAFEPGGVDDELELLKQMITNMPDNEARLVAASMQRMIEANPALIEREDHDALTNLANGIRGKLYTAVSSQAHALVVAIFYKIEHDRHWWRAIFHDPIVQAWWQREVNY